MTGTTTGWIWFESWPLSVCGDESRLISSRWLRFGSVWLHPSFFSETLWSGKIKNTFDNDWWCVFTTNYGAYIAWYFNHSMCIIVYISLQTMASIGKFPSLVTFQTFQVGVEWPVLLGLTIPRRPHLGRASLNLTYLTLAATCCHCCLSCWHWWFHGWCGWHWIADIAAEDFVLLSFSLVAFDLSTEEAWAAWAAWARVQLKTSMAARDQVLRAGVRKSIASFSSRTSHDI